MILQPVSPSLHARDILCPAAAHLATGMPIEELGDAVSPDTLTGLDVAQPEVERGKIRCAVVDFNRFGNVQLNVRGSDLEAAGSRPPRLLVEATSGSAHARQAATYADFAPGDYGVIFDPRGWLTIVRGNPANALEGLGLDVGDPVWISGPPSASEPADIGRNRTRPVRRSATRASRAPVAARAPSSTLRWIAGCSRSTRWKSRFVSTSSRTGVFAVTVDVRGTSVTRAISPKKSPGCMVVTARPSFATVASPSTSAKNSRPRVPP